MNEVQLQRRRRQCPNVLILPSCIALNAEKAARNKTTTLLCVRYLHVYYRPRRVGLEGRSTNK